jgi:hypothetical protein
MARPAAVHPIAKRLDQLPEHEAVFTDLSSGHERSRRVQLMLMLMKPTAQALPPMIFEGRGVLPSQIICCVTDEVKK